MPRDNGPATDGPDNDNEFQRANAQPVVITPELADELARLHGAKSAEHPPFAGRSLTRVEVRWLMHNVGGGEEGPDLRLADLRGVDLSLLNLNYVVLDGARLDGAVLRKSRVMNASLRRAYFNQADLAGASLMWSNAESAYFMGAQLVNTVLMEAVLAGALFQDADLRSAKLFGANLEHAAFWDADLRGADLSRSRLQSASLRGANLAGSTLSNSTLDPYTDLTAATFAEDEKGFAHVSDVRWGGASLHTARWESFTMTGEEYRLREANAADHDRAITAAIRASRQMTVTFNSQGMREEADRMAYRAQVLTTRSVRFRAQDSFLHVVSAAWVRWLGRKVLGALAGYGYKPARTVGWYLATLLAFAILYLQVGQTPTDHLDWHGAVVMSISSFHGRGFFPGKDTVESWRVALAAVEAVIGLFIELTFIATFTQRFLSR